MIFSTTSGAGLYFARFCRSLAIFGSSVGYGRYSSTSRAQRAAFGTPFASRAAWMSAMLAVFALTLRAVAADAAADATGELAAAAAGEAEADDVMGEDAAAAAGDACTTGALVAAAPDAEPDEAADVADGAVVLADGADELLHA